MNDLRKAAEMALEALESLKANPNIEIWSVEADKTMEALRQALAQPVDAVNMTQDRVDETAKREHEPWPSVQCVCGGTIYFKYTPPISDYHEGWEEGFKAAKREWVGLTDSDKQKAFDETQEASGGFWEFADYLEAKLKEKNT